MSGQNRRPRMTAMDVCTGLRRAWTTAGLVAAIGTKAFVHPPFPLRVKPSCNSSTFCAQEPASSRETDTPRRVRPRAAPLSLDYRSRLPESTLMRSSAQQSVDGGVQLPTADRADEYATFLAEAIRQHLDDEWMEQACHQEIGSEVARLFRDAVAEGKADLTTLVLDVGAGLEKVDMGDAFVGPWDIANLTSDFIMQKMGAETSGCSTKAPLPSSSTSDIDSSAAALAGVDELCFTAGEVQRILGDLKSDFSRYRFLKNFMNEDLEWADVNTVMALYQGYTPEGSSEVAGGVRRVWRRTFPGAQPPDLSTAPGVVETLELDYPDDPDLIDGLQVIIETVYGIEAMKIDSGDPDNGVPANKAFVLRSTICKWLYMMGFLNDDIKRAPDDPEDISDIVCGRAKLRYSQKG